LPVVVAVVGKQPYLWHPVLSMVEVDLSPRMVAQHLLIRVVTQAEPMVAGAPVPAVAAVVAASWARVKEPGVLAAARGQNSREVERLVLPVQVALAVAVVLAVLLPVEVVVIAVVPRLLPLALRVIPVPVAAARLTQARTRSWSAGYKRAMVKS
jgi:hypothetical protein